ncbi:putative translation elongation factor eEF-1B gamma subunit [Pleomassaria siparia CBS 279.74]|uniref:Putative translation elongation factor eEF-1B gamma subunit n=1 Tax=Pleomassaria siparia CBS 279.74 TaxID=1314801 RepID=A0A6G1JYI9_9PLEO|nr:putative translation elongation factor eEF-1B gamma subunit [Pleomassaria siparia CBS 279.74]
MAVPFATLWTSDMHSRILHILAAANINKLTLAISPDFVFGSTNKTPTYLAKFPQGKIPALETPSGFLLTEATAIAHFVADSGDKREQLLGRSVEERALVRMWASFSDMEIFANGMVVLAVATGRVEYVAGVTDRKEREFLRALQRLEGHLQVDAQGKGRKWLVRDDELSLADLSVASSLYWPLGHFVDAQTREAFPRLMEWWERLMGVEEVSKAFGKIEFRETRPVVLGEKEAVKE